MENKPSYGATWWHMIQGLMMSTQITLLGGIFVPPGQIDLKWEVCSLCSWWGTMVWHLLVCWRSQFPMWTEHLARPISCWIYTASLIPVNLMIVTMTQSVHIFLACCSEGEGSEYTTFSNKATFKVFVCICFKAKWHKNTLSDLFIYFSDGYSYIINVNKISLCNHYSWFRSFSSIHYLVLFWRTPSRAYGFLGKILECIHLTVGYSLHWSMRFI